MSAFDNTKLKLLFANQPAGQLFRSNRTRSQMRRRNCAAADMPALDHGFPQLVAADFTVGNFIARYRFVSQLGTVNASIRQMPADDAAAQNLLACHRTILQQLRCDDAVAEVAAGNGLVGNLASTNDPVSQLLRTDAAVFQLFTANRMVQQLAAADASFCQMLARYGFRGQFGGCYCLVRDINALHSVVLQPGRADDAEFQLGPVNGAGRNFSSGNGTIGQIVRIYRLEAFLFHHWRYNLRDWRQRFIILIVNFRRLFLKLLLIKYGR
ncbi:hypothetical protein D3C73_501100 [compost metagenome]